MPVWFRNRKTKTRRVDFPVEDVKPVEPKALNQPEDVHLAACNIEVRLPINFGSRSLQVKRLINSRYKNVCTWMKQMKQKT